MALILACKDESLHYSQGEPPLDAMGILSAEVALALEFAKTEPVDLLDYPPFRTSKGILRSSGISPPW